MRDSQKQRVYDAEHVHLRNHPANEYLGDIAACQAFVNKVLARKYVQKHYPVAGRTIRVKGVPSKRNFATAYSSQSRIELGTGENARWSRSTAVVIHEIAHVLAYWKYPEHIGSHDWAFARTFLDLVRNVMGADAADDLKQGFKICKVRMSPPRTRYVTPEQKEAASARLALARAKREEELAPKRAMKDRAIELHGKRKLGYNKFGNLCHEHYLGSGDQKMKIAKDPRRMTYAEIEKALRLYDSQFITLGDWSSVSRQIMVGEMARLRSANYPVKLITDIFS